MQTPLAAAAEARTPRMRRIAAVTTTLAIYALAGAVVTVLIAWGQRHKRGYVLQESQYIGPNKPSKETSWPWRPPATWSANANFVSHDYSSGSVYTYRYLVPDQERTASFGKPYFRELYRMRVAGDGWPFVAVRRISVVDLATDWMGRVNLHVRGDGTLLQVVRQGIQLEKRYTYGRFPLYPAWAGFIANSALWALPFFAIAKACTFQRRRRRRRHGLCPRCKYPVVGLATCPECGTRTSSASPSAPSAARRDW